MYALSPLRYPGGKSRVSNFVKLVCLRNGLVGGHYAEPYAGGASVALGLLFSEIATIVHINDVDPGIMAFWRSVVHETDRFCDAIMETPLTIVEWKKQRAANRSADTPEFERGFATFFLNRTNRSGIIGSGGVIGGLGQTGEWKIDARFPREELVSRVKRVASYRTRLRLTQLDAVEFLDGVQSTLPRNSLVYLDPPYYVKGQGLYPNYYGADDHEAVRNAVEQLSVPWIVSYDNVAPIRNLYAKHPSLAYDLRYSAQKRYDGREVMFFRQDLKLLPEIQNPANVTADRYRRFVGLL